jgi:hypothetical protein
MDRVEPGDAHPSPLDRIYIEARSIIETTRPPAQPDTALRLRPPKRAQSGRGQLQAPGEPCLVHAAALRARAVVLRTARLTLRLALFTSGTCSSVALTKTSYACLPMPRRSRRVILKISTARVA